MRDRTDGAPTLSVRRTGLLERLRTGGSRSRAAVERGAPTHTGPDDVDTDSVVGRCVALLASYSPPVLDVARCSAAVEHSAARDCVAFWGSHVHVAQENHHRHSYRSLVITETFKENYYASASRVGDIKR